MKMYKEMAELSVLSRFIHCRFCLATAVSLLLSLSVAVRLRTYSCSCILKVVDPLANLTSHWRPVVLLNITNQLSAYVVNERLTELVENAGILAQAHGGFRQS